MKDDCRFDAGAVPWDPGFPHRQAGLAVFAHALGTFPLPPADDWPTLEALAALIATRAVTNSARMPLVLVAADGVGAAAYEQRIGERGELAVQARQWHDLLNVCVWALWPAAKAALNRRHCLSLASDPGPQRSPARDALTAFDEDGIVVAIAEPTLGHLVREFRWRELFVDRRASIAHAFLPFVLGHGLCEKLLAPFVGLTAKALLVPVDVGFARSPVAAQVAHLDAAVADIIGDPGRFTTMADLAPLPVLGLPGWWAANADPAFYDDTSYFRGGRRSRATAGAPG